MIAIVQQSRNPFNKSNPFFVPQKFYSEDHLSSYPLRNNLFSHLPQNQKVPLNHSSHTQINRYQQTPSYQTADKDQKQTILKKRNIREMENPFFRKNLIPAGGNLPIGLQPIYMSDNELQLKHERLFYSKKKEKQSQQEKQINDCSLKNPTISQLPSVKNFPEERQRYLPSQFALKLKSQTCLDDNMSFPLSKCDTNQIPVSLGKSQSRITDSQCLRIPQTIVVRGKTYYSQNIVSIY